LIKSIFWWGAPREGDHSVDLGVDDRIILNESSGSGMERHGLDCSGSGYGRAAGACERGYESSSSTKCREFLE